MRWSLVLALATFSVAVFAQNQELVSAPSPNVAPHVQLYRAFDFHEGATSSTWRHAWYWEVPDFRPSQQDINRYLPRGAKASSDDFEPASLRWNLEGKRKIVPVIDLTVMQIKPGERSSPPVPSSDNGTSQFAPGALWTKATHSISELLHY